MAVFIKPIRGVFHFYKPIYHQLYENFAKKSWWKTRNKSTSKNRLKPSKALTLKSYKSIYHQYYSWDLKKWALWLLLLFSFGALENLILLAQVSLLYCVTFSVFQGKNKSKDSRRNHLLKFTTMVGIFSRFSVGRSGHRRTQSAIVSSLSSIFLSYSSTCFMGLSKL